MNKDSSDGLFSPSLVKLSSSDSLDSHHNVEAGTLEVPFLFYCERVTPSYKN